MPASTPTEGSEQTGIRPAVIVSRDAINIEDLHFLLSASLLANLGFMYHSEAQTVLPHGHRSSTWAIVALASGSQNVMSMAV
jgi:hypothetical protein